MTSLGADELASRLTCAQSREGGVGPEEAPALPLLFDVSEVSGEHVGTADVGTPGEDVPCVAGSGSLREKAGRKDLIS